MSNHFRRVREVQE